MNRPLLYILTILALALTVPWFFSGDSDKRILGFPVWAAWAVGASALYAVLIAFLIGRYWDLSAGGEDEKE